MQPLVTTGAALTCPFGVAPSTLTATPPPVVSATTPAATIMDITPANFPPFGMCTTPSNPQVAAATSAASGVLTPQPCMPVITAPWAPGSAKVTIGGKPALTAASTCSCAWGGVITITSPGQTTVMVG